MASLPFKGRGNPDFGVRYKSPLLGDEPRNRLITMQLGQAIKTKVIALASCVIAPENDALAEEIRSCYLCPVKKQVPNFVRDSGGYRICASCTS